MSSCESKCLVCEKPGIFDINFSGFHKVCLDHATGEAPGISCIFCKSEVLIFEDFFICNNCKTRKVSNRCRCGLAICESCSGHCKSCSTQCCPNCIPDSSKKCKRCQLEESKKKNGSGSISLQRPKQLENRENEAVCDRCSVIGETYKGNCKHYFCVECLDAPCSECLTHSYSQNFRSKQGVKILEKCDFCNHKKENLKKIRNKKLCNECEETHFKRIYEFYCKNCGEHEKNEIMKCAHYGCTSCISKNLICFSCILNTKRDNNNFYDNCSFCSKQKNCFKLFCEHSCCIECMNDFSVQKLNYMCKECILKNQKFCLECNNLAMWQEAGKKNLIRICCKEYKVCRNCLKKDSFWHKCKVPDRK